MKVLKKSNALSLPGILLGLSLCWQTVHAQLPVVDLVPGPGPVIDNPGVILPPLPVPTPTVSYEYAAKIVCGIQEEPENLMLTRGVYATAINIHNPNDVPVKFTKTLALTYPPGFQKPGEVLRIAEDLLQPGEALVADCMDIEERLFPFGFPTPFIEGFVVIESPKSLDVSAVYTSASLDLQESNIDVEQIRERVKKKAPQALPDLVVRDIGPPDVNCPTGAGSCVTKVSFTVANIGVAATGPCTVRVAFDPSHIVTLPIAGLAAGASQTYSAVTPPGGNCYDPDCTICVTVDSQHVVPESNESNNQLCETTQG